MENLRFDYSKAVSFFAESEINNMKDFVANCHDMLHETRGQGSEFTGWVELPSNYDKNEFDRIKLASTKIKKDSEVLVVIGIGGSYLGAKAVIDALSHSFFNNLSNDKRGVPQVVFAGNNISSTYLNDLLEMLEGKDFSINVISKSGTTTEPAIAFRVLKDFLVKKYGVDEAKERIYVTTDKSKGALKELSKEQGYETFVVPDDVGGRFSVLTAVGLLPIAVSGADIDKIMEGARNAQEHYNNRNLEENDCYQYAVLRNVFYRKNKTTEILVGYEPCLQYFVEWWKQLYGESEGKDKKGIFPAGVSFTADLHSMGQYVQDGLRNIFQTIINVKTPRKDILVNNDPDNVDGLNFLSGKSFDYINKKAFEGTLMAHNDGGVPNLVINIEKLDEFNIGSLIYFFEKACAISGYLLGVNPFDQPGVEEYKKNMFALLGKPGFEDRKKELENRGE